MYIFKTKQKKDLIFLKNFEQKYISFEKLNMWLRRCLTSVQSKGGAALMPVFPQFTVMMPHLTPH